MSDTYYLAGQTDAETLDAAAQRIYEFATLSDPLPWTSLLKGGKP